MSTILGLTSFHAGASACLVVDGVPVFAIAEERINRVKYYADFPKLAIRACLDFAGIGWGEIDHVAVGRDPASNKVQKAKFALKHISRLPALLARKYKMDVFGDMKGLIADQFGLDPEALKFQVHNVEHHVAHTASSYFISPWEKAAGVSLDGSGDFVSGTITDCEGDRIRVIRKVFLPDSLGTFYTMACQMIGYGKYGDEGKVMGLAPYGRDSYAETFRDIIRTTPKGYRLGKAWFRPFADDGGLEILEDGQMKVRPCYSEKMVEVFGPPREPGTDYAQRDMDIAFAVQKRFEEVYMHVLDLAAGAVKSDRVALSGGCALNSVANGKLFGATPYRETAINPAAGDDGLAMGAALHVSNAVLKEGRRWAIRDAYFGNEFSESAVRTALEDRGVIFRKLDRDELVEETADLIADGKVLGWFQGRMEWGPRALGNRSILVHPGYPGMKDILNARIKRREWFRPFAPAVLAERQRDIFEHTHPSPFMLHVYKIKPEWRKRLSAVNHEDNTGRLQTVTREENALYYDLISAFEKRTGTPVLLNTSFNENEPIVRTPEEAIDCFLRTKMDVLGIGPFLCLKTDQPERAEEQIAEE